MFHLGAPANVRCQYDGLGSRRVQTRGRFDVIPRGCRADWDDDDPTLSLNVWFADARIEAAASSMRIPATAGSFRPLISQEDARLFALAQLVQAEIHTPEPDNLFADSLAAAMTTRLLQHSGLIEVMRASSTLSRRQLGRVLEYVEAHLDGDVRLATLASLAGLSESHFRVLFRQTVGQPVHQFVVDRRLERARALLESGQAPIAEIAAECGFCHQSHMAKAMRRKWSVTPAQMARDGDLARRLAPSSPRPLTGGFHQRVAVQRARQGG